MKNTGFLGVAHRYLLRIILQINNAIPYLLAVQEKFISRLKFFFASQLKIELSPLLIKFNMKTKVT